MIGQKINRGLLTCVLVLTILSGCFYILSACAADGYPALKVSTQKNAAIDAMFLGMNSKIPAEHNDIMNIRVKKTGAMEYEVRIEYALVNYSETILAAAVLMKDGQNVTGSYLPTPITPGKGWVAVKIVKAPDPFNQVEIQLYKKSGSTELFSKRFDYAENEITSVGIVKKSDREYAIDIRYRLSSGFAGAVTGAFPLQNGQEVMGWAYIPEVVKPGEGHTVVTVKWVEKTTPKPFNQIRGKLYTVNQQLAKKIVDLNASTPMKLDSIKALSILGGAIDSLNFKVDYAYGSDLGNVKLAAYMINGGYPVDWIKCSQPYAHKGSGAANIACNFGGAASLPQGIFDISTSMIRVQLMSEGSAAPIAAKAFPYQKVWSVDNLRNFRITAKTSNVVDFLVDYTYATKHGGTATIGAKAISGGVVYQSYIQSTKGLSPGNGTFAGKLNVPAGKPIQQVYIFMYAAGGSVFYGKVFNYPLGAAAAHPSAVMKKVPAF